ncbi:MAG: hypothetical protein KBS56_03935 [Clostridiales bacterium]|nr:hypothetical protein [Candidatus Crickella equi]
MKKIIITGGPTNERIDEVMKITNMSTGGTSVALAETFASHGYEVVAILNNMVKMEPRDNLRIVRVENTEDMLAALENEARLDDTDAIIHAAAVGDYKGDFTFLLEDMADEIYKALPKIKSAEDILRIMEDPKCKIDNSSKISSYQKNLTVKLGLTTKIISKLRFWYPKTLLIGCKLLDNVEKGELFDVATALCNKNDMDYILANDLADLQQGKLARYLVNKDGFTQIVLENTDAIFKFVDDKLN